MQKKVFDAVGGFREDLTSNEDVDLCFRAKLAGWDCVFVPDAVVWHRVSFSTKTFSDRSIYWSKRNSFWVMIKNLPFGIFLRHSFHIIGYNLLSDLRWIFGGRIKPVIKGRWDGFAKLSTMLRKRKIILKNRKISQDRFSRTLKVILKNLKKERVKVMVTLTGNMMELISSEIKPITSSSDKIVFMIDLKPGKMEFQLTLESGW